MKRFFQVFLVAVLLSFSSLVFAAGNSSVGNGEGTNKLGGIIGLPIGLSFSHNFTKVDQIDLTVAFFPGVAGRHYGRYFSQDIALGYLRTIFEPNINGAGCPFEIGGGASFSMGLLTGFSSWLTIYLDLRWEFFFTSTPKFNLFLDFSPGIGFYLAQHSYVYYAPRGGIGLRAVL